MAATEAALDRARALMDANILDVGGRAWTGRDLVTAGTLTGQWPAMERDLEAGVVALDHWQPSADAVRAAVRDFRYERRLVSAEEYAGWLASRDLRAADVRAVVSRRLARQRGAATVVDRDRRDTDQAGARTRPELVAELAAEAICSGTLARSGQWLIDRLLCHAEAPGQDVSRRAVDQLLADEGALLAANLAFQLEADRRRRAELFVAADIAYQAHVRDLCSDRAIESCLRRHALDWIRFELDELSCATPGAAAEAAELLREGAATARVGELAGVPVVGRDLYLEDAPAAIQGSLGAATAGAIVGPAEIDGWHRVWQVKTRRAASATDPDNQARAAAEIVADQMARRRAGKVRWHDHH
ncbi:MAG: hypothetical protein JOZ07_06845 [Solirubrobacterales bacterium]|nr:hypothetical protein [Solirubrobacterales bacterium]